jgi:hypothetical protein
LISDKKKIGFLFGAGSSLAMKNKTSLTVPAIGKMTSEIVEEVGKVNAKYKTALEEIKEELEEKNFNIETILSKLEQKFSFIGKNILNSLNKDEFANLIKIIKKEVREKVSVHNITLCDIVSKKEFKQIVAKDIVNELVIKVFKTRLFYIPKPMH